MKRSWLTILLTGIVWIGLLTGCQAIDRTKIATPAPQTKAEPITITILTTSDEHGWLQP